MCIQSGNRWKKRGRDEHGGRWVSQGGRWVFQEGSGCPRSRGWMSAESGRRMVTYIGATAAVKETLLWLLHFFGRQGLTMWLRIAWNFQYVV